MVACPWQSTEPQIRRSHSRLLLPGRYVRRNVLVLMLGRVTLFPMLAVRFLLLIFTPVARPPVRRWGFACRWWWYQTKLGVSCDDAGDLDDYGVFDGAYQDQGGEVDSVFKRCDSECAAADLEAKLRDFNRRRARDSR